MEKLDIILDQRKVYTFEFSDHEYVFKLFAHLQMPFSDPEGKFAEFVDKAYKSRDLEKKREVFLIRISDNCGLECLLEKEKILIFTNLAEQQLLDFFKHEESQLQFKSSRIPHTWEESHLNQNIAKTMPSNEENIIHSTSEARALDRCAYLIIPKEKAIKWVNESSRLLAKNDESPILVFTRQEILDEPIVILGSGDFNHIESDDELRSLKLDAMIEFFNSYIADETYWPEFNDVEETFHRYFKLKACGVAIDTCPNEPIYI